MSAQGDIQIVGLFISPGHNFFGHHGHPAGGHPLIAVNELQCIAGKGVAGDRFFDFKHDYKGQITFFSGEVFDEVCRTLNVSGRSAGVTRRNVITRGVDLNSMVGTRFEVQGVTFEGVCECTPCYWMNEAIGPGAERALRGRGGLRARILTDGLLNLRA